MWSTFWTDVAYVLGLAFAAFAVSALACLLLASLNRGARAVMRRRQPAAAQAPPPDRRPPARASAPDAGSLP